MCFSFFFFNDTATTEIYTLSLHDALPILRGAPVSELIASVVPAQQMPGGLTEEEAATAGVLHEQNIERARELMAEDRKSTRLNSSHANISYAVFCLKKKKKKLCVTQSKYS